jgi:hypothetical protein
MSQTNRPLTTIQLEISGCDKCPLSIQRRTPEAGYAWDYFCTRKMDDKYQPVRTMYYIEYENEKTPVPDWCPQRIKEDV